MGALISAALARDVVVAMSETSAPITVVIVHRESRQETTSNFCFVAREFLTR